MVMCQISSLDRDRIRVLVELGQAQGQGDDEGEQLWYNTGHSSMFILDELDPTKLFSKVIVGISQSMDDECGQLIKYMSIKIKL